MERLDEINQRSLDPISIVIDVGEGFPERIAGVDDGRDFIFNDETILLRLLTEGIDVFHFVMLLSGAGDASGIGAGGSFGVAANENNVVLNHKNVSFYGPKPTEFLSLVNRLFQKILDTIIKHPKRIVNPITIQISTT